jgi:sn-glycerol 3-phosphate transport system substrate-binding protein
MTMRVRRALLVTIAMVTAAACGGGGGDDGGDANPTNPTGVTPTNATVPDLSDQCPLDAIESADGPIDIKYWHAMTRENEATLVTLTDDFNANQDAVHVELVNQNSYTDNFTKFETAYDTDDSPDLVQLEDTALQRLVDAQVVVPAQACLDAAGETKDDFVDRVANYYSIGGVLYPMPFNVSNPVFYYNKKAFETAGLDPDAPPTTFAEVRQYAETLQGAGFTYGFGFKRDPWVLEQFLALGGEPYVNNDNGRSSRATEAVFNTDTALTAFEWLDEGVDAGVFFTNPASGASGFDNLLSICNGENAMTIDTSAALGTATKLLEQEGCKAEVEVGVAPLPLPTADGAGKGGVLVGGAANYLPANGDPARLAAAYTFAAFLASPDSQATWAAGTGYIPVRESSAESQIMLDLWAESPGFKVAFDQLLSGADNVATAGPVIGDYKGVRDALTDALESFLVESTSPVDALAAAKEAADEKIAAYNATVT